MKNKNAKNAVAVATIGRPEIPFAWPNKAFTLAQVLDRRNATKRPFTTPGLKARALRHVAAGTLFECGVKPRKAGEAGRPSFLYSLNPNDVPKELRTPAIHGAIRSYNRKNAKAA